MCFHPNKLGETFVDLSVLKDPPPPPPPPLGPPVLISHLHILRSMVLDLMACSCWSKVFAGRSCYPVMVITQVKFPLTRFAFARFTFYLDKFCKFWINFPWPVFPWPVFPWPNFPWPNFPWPIFPWPIFPWPIFPWPLFPWPFFPWPIFPNTAPICPCLCYFMRKKQLILLGLI